MPYVSCSNEGKKRDTIAQPEASNTLLGTIFSYPIFLLFVPISFILISNRFWVFQVNEDVFPPKFYNNSSSSSNLL
jgi:hypothetical protein